MDTLYLVIVGAIGWAGFGCCVWVLKTRRQLEFRVVSFNDIVKIEPNAEGIHPHIIKETVIESEIPEEMHRLAEIAEPLLDQYDTVPQSGEWKRHQVYAAMLKNPKVKEIIGDDKWKAGFAIELAVAQRRMNAEYAENS